LRIIRPDHFEWCRPVHALIQQTGGKLVAARKYRRHRGPSAGAAVAERVRSTAGDTCGHSPCRKH